MRKLLLACSVALLVCLGLFACAQQMGTPKETTVTIFHTGNVMGELERCGCSEKQLGGVARRKTVYDRYRSENTLLVDSGDLFFDSFDDLVGSREFYRLKASAMVRSMNKMGYDAAMVGDYDFAEGASFLLDRVKEASFPFVCANLVNADGKPVLAPYRIVSKRGVKVALVGFLDDHVVTKSYREALGNLKILDPFQTARKILPQVKRKSNLVVALLHFNLVNVEDFLKANPEIDVAIIGHKVGTGEAKRTGRTITVSDSELGKELGRLTLHLDREGNILSFDASMIPIDEEIAKDPTVEEEVIQFNATVENKKMSEDVFFVPATQDRSQYVGAQTCAPCHPVIYQRWSNTPHAYAYDTLTEKGAEYDPECVICHVVGYRERKGFVGIDRTPDLANVQCESCHGAGADHLQGKPMIAMVPEDTCRKCHNVKHSPSFDYSTYLALSDQCTLH
jgi:2',3'-cyclic-nucleotide 2'-phosphodiesterase (5'-nucleotidase family)